MGGVRTCKCGGEGVVFKTEPGADAHYRFLRCKRCGRIGRTVEISVAAFDEMVIRAKRFDRTIAGVAAVLERERG